jgi:hypothetical protein
MADQQLILQNCDNSKPLLDSGATGVAQNPNQVLASKKHLVKSNPVLEYIANTIQSKVGKFCLHCKENAY